MKIYESFDDLINENTIDEKYWNNSNTGIYIGYDIYKGKDLTLNFGQTGHIYKSKRKYFFVADDNECFDQPVFQVDIKDIKRTGVYEY